MEEQTNTSTSASVTPKHSAIEAFLKGQPSDKELERKANGEKEEKSNGEIKEEEKVEPPKEVEKPPAKIETDIFNERFAALSRRERFLSQRERSIKDQLKQIENLQKEKEDFDKDPYGYLEKKGHSYENWTKRILSGEKPEEKEAQTEIKRELQLLKEDREQEKQKSVEQARYQTYVGEMSKINDFVNENIESLPLVNLFGDAQLIFDIRAESYTQDVKSYGEEYAKGNILSIEQAAQLAEDYRKGYIQERKSALEIFQKKIPQFLTTEQKVLQEVQEQSGESEPSLLKVPESSQETQKFGVRTLTNQQQTNVPAKEVKPFKSDTERLQHASQFLKYR